MGRRVTSTTKGGKFMNPTDQARKEARRRELKKNKKQRMAVRQAVIKTKDPYHMLRELEELDDMELDPTTETHYNEKVIRDKRRKLLETLVRILEFYFKEDSVRGHDLKTLFDNYKLNRAKKELYYESVKNAQSVEITSIPLPDAPFETPHLSDIPLPGIKPASILKKVPPGPPTGLPPMLRTERAPPGPPPGVPPAKKVFGRGPDSFPDYPPPDSPPSPVESEDEREMDDAPYDPEEELDLMDEVHLPPDLDEDDDDEEEFHHRDDDDVHDENESDDDNDLNRKRSVRFVDDNDDEEDDEKDREDKPKRARQDLPPGMTPLQAMMLKLAGQAVPTAGSSTKDAPYDPLQEEEYEEDEAPIDEDAPKGNRPKPPGPPPGLPPGPPPGMPPAMMGRPGMMPPGPPPGRPPTMPMNMGPRMMGPPEDHGMRMMPNPNVLSAPPSLIHRPSDKDIDESATITAKPKLTTNPKVDSTRFMPTSLRVRREVKGRSGAAGAGASSSTTSEKQTHERKKKQQTNTADAAYDSFMKEMQGLL